MVRANSKNPTLYTHCTTLYTLWCMPVHRVVIEDSLYRRIESLARQRRQTVPAVLASILEALLTSPTGDMHEPANREAFFQREARAEREWGGPVTKESQTRRKP